MTADAFDIEEMGPVDYMVLEFARLRVTGTALRELMRLANEGLIRVLDLVFVRKDARGSVRRLPLSALDVDDSFELSALTGAASGLLGADDIREAGAVLEPGNAAAILVYENLWAAPLAILLRRNGAQLVASGRIQLQAMLAALDATEPSVAGSATATTQQARS